MGFVLGVLNPHVVEIGSVVIHWYGVIIAAGILAALQLSTKEA
ncbi:prolipoprotein diacylglyceryl transferase, partial [Enterococcus lactis]|nr:prolipoprotein diacylglyceryl transferase [Enterococcus lactis]